MTWSLRSLLVLLSVSAWLVATSAHAQVDPASPVASPSVEQQIPSLPFSTGVLFEAPVSATDTLSLHEGRFTWGPDLLAPPTADRYVWTTGLFATPGGALQFTAAPALEADVNLALSAADGTLDALDAGGISSIFTAFADAVNAIPGANAEVTHTPTAPVTSFLGYAPIRARWLRSQWASVGPITANPFQPVKKFTYQDYLGFRDIRLRGARLYCAARTAQAQQAGQRLSLGERVGFGVSILGQQIDFMVIEPSVALNGPAKFFAPGDGAQAFTIPLLLGTSITPIRGIGLPSLGEARVPVTFITADTEVRTLAAKRLIRVKTRHGPVFINDYSKEYHTVTHADAFVSAGFYEDQRFAVDSDFLLFTVGPLEVRGLLGLDYNVGKLYVNTPEVPDDRVLVNFPGWPPTARTGRFFANLFSGHRYHDGPWALAAHRGSKFFQWEVQPEGKTESLWTAPIFPFIRPHDVRALTDDDHVMSSATSLALQLGLRGVLGVDDFGPFDVKVGVDGSFTGTVTQYTVLRDALMAQAPVGFTIMRPFTSLTVRPRQEADVQFDGLRAALTFHLDLGFFGDIEFTKTFIDTPAVPIAKYNSDDSLAPADEQFMLRLATGASTGNAMSKPTVLSHLPGRQEFSTFPVDVATCLADETPLQPPPTECHGGSTTGAPPHVEMCLYGPELVVQENFLKTALPAGVCSNIQSWLGPLSLTGGQKLCLAKYLGFLCSPVSKQQTWNGAQVVSRVWNLDPKLNAELQGIAEECGEAFVGTELPPDDPTVHAAIQDFTAGLIGVAACTSNATLIPGPEIISIISQTTALPATPGQPCQ